MEDAISSTLLENIDPNRQVSKDFNLGMDEFAPVGTVESTAVSGTQDDYRGLPTCSEYEPRPKKSKPAPDTTRYYEPRPKKSKPAPQKTRYYRATTEELQNLSTPYVPKNTDASTKWAYNNFQSWVEQRNSSEAADTCPADLLEKAEPHQLDKWLSLYVIENRKVNGEPYPSRTIYSLLTGLLRYMRSKNDAAPNFLEKQNPRFKQLHSTMDSIFRSLREQGIGAQKKAADPFSKNEEIQLWTLGVMGIDTPLTLFRAVFFYNGKNFCLRGGEEHRNLKLSQLKRTGEGYIYTENASKNRAGGLSQLRLENKIVPVMAHPEVGRYCHCELLDIYISKLPSKIKEMDIFYARPLNQRPDDESAPWFAPVPVGRNKLSKVVSDMCHEAQIDGHKTNHSLRATGATQLSHAGVPEKIIQQ